MSDQYHLAERMAELCTGNLSDIGSGPNPEQVAEWHTAEETASKHNQVSLDIEASAVKTQTLRLPPDLTFVKEYWRNGLLTVTWNTLTAWLRADPTIRTLTPSIVWGFCQRFAVKEQSRWESPMVRFHRQQQVPAR